MLLIKKNIWAFRHMVIEGNTSYSGRYLFCVSLSQKVFLRPTTKNDLKKSYELLILIRKSTASNFY